MSDLPPEVDRKLADQASKDLAQRAALGMDVQNWLRSSIGRTVCERAEERREGLVNQLITCETRSEAGRARNAQLRFEIAVVDFWQNELASLVGEGQIAERELTAYLEA